jgi:hypothetical protein
MDISDFLAAAKMVLTDKRVITTAVVVFLCMDFGVFVANYSRKPPRPKRTRPSPKPASVPSAEGDGSAAETAQGGTAAGKSGNSPSK